MSEAVSSKAFYINNSENNDLQDDVLAETEKIENLIPSRSDYFH